MTVYVIIAVAIFGAIYGLSDVASDIPIIGALFDFIHTGLDGILDVGFDMIVKISGMIFDKVGQFINIK